MIDGKRYLKKNLAKVYGFPKEVQFLKCCDPQKAVYWRRQLKVNHITYRY